jgi:hypothetical protein
MKDIRPRWFGRNLATALKILPVTVVTGARQTGKTTLVKTLGSTRTYLTLDEVSVLDRPPRVSRLASEQGGPGAQRGVARRAGPSIGGRRAGAAVGLDGGNRVAGHRSGRIAPRSGLGWAEVIV